MIQVLFTVLGLEVALVLVLLFKTPLRKVAILGLDRLKRGRGPVMVKTVAATVLVVLASSGYSIVKIHDRSNEMGQLTPTDQVLASRHLLEASLMGNFSVSPYPCAQSLSVWPIRLVLLSGSWNGLSIESVYGPELFSIFEDDMNLLKLLHILTVDLELNVAVEEVVCVDGWCQGFVKDLDNKKDLWDIYACKHNEGYI
jgi:hypothetical protein